MGNRLSALQMNTSYYWNEIPGILIPHSKIFSIDLPEEQSETRKKRSQVRGKIKDRKNKDKKTP